MTMTPEAKRRSRSTIRPLRARLLARPARRHRVGLPAGGAAPATPVSPRPPGPGGDGSTTGSTSRSARRRSAGARASGPRRDFRREAEKQAAYTLLNRLVFLRLMEAPGPSGTPLRESRGHRRLGEPRLPGLPPARAGAGP